MPRVQVSHLEVITEADDPPPAVEPPPVRPMPSLALILAVTVVIGAIVAALIL